MPPENTNPTIELPFTQSHAFIIGINNYRNGIAVLKSAIKDAEDVAKLLSEEHGYIVHTCYDATRDDMYEIFEEMKKVVNPEDRVIFYFAGHGYAFDSEKDPEGFLIPVDATKKNKKSLVPMDDLHKYVTGLKCKHGLLILDCCFSGSFKWSSTRGGFMLDEAEPLYEERFFRFVRNDAWQVITSAAHDQKAIDIFSHQAIGLRDGIEGAEDINSPFATALKQAINLEGRADVVRGKRSDGVITATELYAYLRDIVETETEKHGKRQSPSIFTLNKHDKGEFIFLHPGHKLNLAPAPDTNPYKGLGGFKKEDASLFFGREEVIKTMAEKLENTSILVVSGPSGQGKSSTIKAGLFPFLEKHYGYKVFNSCRPGANPLESLNKLPPYKKQARQVLLIDKYEEFFSDAEYSAGHLGFEALLSGYLEDAKDHPVKIILSIRSDFEWELKSSTFGELFWDHLKVREFLYRLPPMTKEDLRQMTVRPAWVIAYEFESDEMVDQILEEIDNSPGALPLLSFTLHKLYEFRDTGKRIFTLDAYKNKLKGINGALSTLADEIYDNLETESHQEVMRLLFLRMINLNDGSYTRRRVYRQYFGLTESLNELDYPDHRDDVVDEVLKKLVAENLISGDFDEIGDFYEPMHNALINYWPKCLEWIKDFKKENLDLQRKLWQAVLESKKQQKIEFGGMYTQQLGTHVSPFWDTNPKLAQVIDSIIDAASEILTKAGKEHPLNAEIEIIGEALEGEDKYQYNSLLHDCALKGKMPNLDAFILSGASAKLLDAFLDKTNHWLNQAEVFFIRESWKKRTADILQLKKDKDEAIQARNEAQAGLLTVRAKTKLGEDPTIALNFVNQALKIVPNKDVVQAFSEISHRDHSYYKKRYEIAEFTSFPSIHLSGDGKLCLLVYSVFSDQERATLIDLESEEIKSLGFEGRHLDKNAKIVKTSPVAFSKDGSYFIYALPEGIYRWNVKEDTGDQIVNSRNAWDFSSLTVPDNDFLLAGTTEGAIHLWPLDNKEEQPGRIFQGHSDMVTSIAVAANGKSFVSGSRDGTVKLWEVKSGKSTETLMGGNGHIMCVDISGKGDSVIAGDDEGNVVFLEIGNPSPKGIFEGHERAVLSISFSPEGDKFLTGGSDQKAMLWNVNDASAPLREFKSHPSEVTSVAFFPEGEILITASAIPVIWKGVLRDIADAGSGKTVVTIWHSGSAEELYCHSTNCPAERIIVLPDGQSFISFGGKEGDAGFDHWTLSSKKSEKVFPEPECETLCANVSPDSRYFASGNKDGSIVLWEMWSDAPGVILVSEDNTPIKQIEFSPAGKYLVSISKDAKITLWLAESGEKLRSMAEAGSGFDFLSFSHDEKLLIAGSSEGNAESAGVLWEIPSGKVVRTLEGNSEKDMGEIPGFEKDPDSDGFVHLAFRGFDFSPDGKTYAAIHAKDPDEIKLWEVETGNLICTFKEYHTMMTSGVSYSSDGRFLISCGYVDGKIKIWHAATGQLIREFGKEGIGNIVSVRFSDDDAYFVSVQEDGIVKFWHNPLHSWDERIYKLTEEEMSGNK